MLVDYTGEGRNVLDKSLFDFIKFDISIKVISQPFGGDIRFPLSNVEKKLFYYNDRDIVLPTLYRLMGKDRIGIVNEFMGYINDDSTVFSVERLEFFNFLTGIIPMTLFYLKTFEDFHNLLVGICGNMRNVYIENVPPDNLMKFLNLTDTCHICHVDNNSDFYNMLNFSNDCLGHILAVSKNEDIVKRLSILWWSGYNVDDTVYWLKPRAK